MNNFNKIQNQLRNLKLDEIEDQLQKGELTHINITYNPDNKYLQIGGHKEGHSDFRVLCETEIDIDTYAALLVRVIGNPAFITSNTEGIANVDVEFGAFR